MRTLAAWLSIAMLAACQRAEPVAQPARAAPGPSPAPTSHAVPGTYSVTEADGTKVTTVLARDHTYTRTVHGHRTEAGVWAIVAGRTCFTPRESAGSVARCYTESAVGKDGAYVATPDKGLPITVKRIA